MRPYPRLRSFLHRRPPGFHHCRLHRCCLPSLPLWLLFLLRRSPCRLRRPLHRHRRPNYFRPRPLSHRLKKRPRCPQSKHRRCPRSLRWKTHHLRHRLRCWSWWFPQRPPLGRPSWWHPRRRPRLHHGSRPCRIRFPQPSCCCTKLANQQRPLSELPIQETCACRLLAGLMKRAPFRRQKHHLLSCANGANGPRTDDSSIDALDALLLVGLAGDYVPADQ